MLSLTSFRFDAWIDGDRNACAVQLARPEGAKGLTRVWFVLESHELDGLCTGSVSAAEDGYHKLTRHGDTCTFYDFMMPGGGAGEVIVPYVSLHMPRAFWRYLRAIARGYWRAARADAEGDTDAKYRQPRLETVIPRDVLARFDRRYGHGHGRVRVEASERFAADIRARGLSFWSMVDRLSTIARNYTSSVYQETTLRIMDDGAGYFWTTTRGTRRGLHGGLINHGRDGTDDWSIHT